MKQSTKIRVVKLAAFAFVAVAASGSIAQASHHHHRKHRGTYANHNLWRQNSSTGNWQVNRGQRGNSEDPSYPDTSAVRYHRSGTGGHRSDGKTEPRDSHWDSNGSWRNRNGANPGNGRWNTNGDWRSRTDNWPPAGTNGRMRHRSTGQDSGR